jgi:acetyl-CoA carboxylase biotin carboxyl carrier protein
MRVSVRRADEPGSPGASAAPVRRRAEARPSRRGAGTIRVESPMVGVFYRASQPGAPPFVEVGDVVTPARRSASSRR